MDKTKAFGQYMNDVRYGKRVTLTELSMKIGFTPPYISDIEKGRRNPPKKEKLDTWIKGLGITEKSEIEQIYTLAGRARGTVPVDIEEMLVSGDEELFRAVREFLDNVQVKK